MSRLADLEANLTLLNKKLAELERAKIITSDAAQKFALEHQIADVRKEIAEVETEKSGMSGEAKTGASAGAPGTQNAAVNGPAGQVVIVQNLYGNLTTSGAEERQASPMAGGKFVNVPARNEFFTGREEILSKLHATLKAGGRAAIKQAISGLGGIGKTQTAIEYAYRYANDYAWILWTNAESESALDSGVAAFAPELGLTVSQDQAETVKGVKRWLGKNANWLLILDNADEPEIVKKFLPNQYSGKVLLTSRAQNFRSVGIANPVNLSVMTEAEALEFFAKSLGVEEIASPEMEAAKALAAELGYLPLALEQAAAYISVEEVTFGEYLGKYRELRAAIFGMSEAQAGNYKETVMTTWRLNFEKVEKDGAGAGDILRVSAFFSAEAIPFELIGRGGAEISEAAKEAVKGGAYVSEALTPLTRYSLIERDKECETFSVHRLVQAVMRERLGEAQREWAERAVRATNAAFPESGDFKHWPMLERLTPHGAHLEKVIEEFGIEFLEAGRLLNQTGYYLKERGRYAEAKPMYERALAIREKALGAEHPDTAVSLNNLALLYYAQGEYGKAEPMYERALAVKEKALGAEHPSTADSLNNLALLYYAQGNYAKAEPLFKRALLICNSVLGKNHPYRAMSLWHIGALRRAQGRLEEASELHGEALEILTGALGAEHSHTKMCAEQWEELQAEIARRATE
jgi:tetratricopeptide (TPR) repeat protein